jgi:PAS domain S-box-containing protein
VATWEWDLDAGEARYSAGATDLLGVGGDAVDPDPAFWHRHVVPDDRARVVEAVRRAIARGENWSMRYRLQRAGEPPADVLERAFVVCDGGGRAHRVLGFVEREAVEVPAASDELPLLARIRQSEMEFRTFVDWIPHLAWVAGPDGWLTYYNRRWFEYTGTTPEQMEGWGWVVVHDPGDLPRMLRIWRNALVTGQPWEDEFRMRRADGMLRWHLSRAMPFRDAEGRILRWFGTNTDIHDQKLAAEEYSRLLAREKQARREAEAANRARDEFLAVVSHELRTPLNAVLGWAQMLQSGSLDEAKARRAVEKIESNAKLQAKLIEDLLDVSRIITGKLAVEHRVMELAPVIRAAVAAAQPDAGAKGVTLVKRNEAPGAHVRGDPGRLQQVVGNLLHNALKFTPAGGRVTVTVRRAGASVEIEVCDEGEGIAPDFLPHLFQRFSQAEIGTTRRHGGMGLGLAIVRQLVELHGGEVSAASEGEGKGATFTVRLPELTSAEMASPAVDAVAPHAPAPAVSLAGIKVLGVDDEQSSREVLAEVLLSCGATVTLASGVHEALRAFKVDRPDAIVSDIGMPELDGYALVERIRALPDPEASRTPIVALTAYASLQDRERALRLGFDRYLTKPIEPGPLSRMVADLVRRRVVPSGEGREPGRPPPRRERRKRMRARVKRGVSTGRARPPGLNAACRDMPHQPPIRARAWLTRSAFDAPTGRGGIARRAVAANRAAGECRRGSGPNAADGGPSPERRLRSPGSRAQAPSHRPGLSAHPEPSPLRRARPASRGRTGVGAAAAHRGACGGLSGHPAGAHRSAGAPLFARPPAAWTPRRPRLPGPARPNSAEVPPAGEAARATPAPEVRAPGDAAASGAAPEPFHPRGGGPPPGWAGPVFPAVAQASRSARPRRAAPPRRLRAAAVL